MVEARKPILPPIEPPQKIKDLATILANAVDAYSMHTPITYNEALQSLEWLRWCVTECIIKQHDGNGDTVHRG